MPSHLTTTIIILISFSILESRSQKISDVLKTHQSKIFQNYKSKYSKKYKDQSQELYRNLVVYNNANKIANHNLNISRTYSLGINVYADLNQEEFQLRYTGYQISGEGIKENIRLEKKRKEIDQRECLCDNYRMNQLILIEQRKQIIKTILNQTKQFKKKRKDQSVLLLDRNISQFQQNIQFLSVDELEVTAAMKKEIQANLTKNMVKNSVVPNLANVTNLKKEDPLMNSRSPVNPIPTITSYTGTMVGVKLQLVPSSPPSPKTPSPAMTELQKQILGSLGDRQITTPKITISSTPQTLTPSSPLLKQTLSTTTTTTTATQTTSNTTTISATTATPAAPTISIDWSNYTGTARHQGLCGSCYALVAVGNVQALYAIYSFGFYVQMSPQQVLDCSDNGLTFGCDGGYIQGSLLHIKNKGTSSQRSYPYTSGLTGTSGTCKSPTGPFKITQFRNLAAGDCADIKKQLAKKPLAVAIASFNLQFYQSGTFTDCNTQIDHAVLLVGFHSTKGWKIKNSWGAAWGEAGFAWIQDGNSCGICEGAIVASIAGQPVA